MIDVKEFYSELDKYDINFYCGVPDSLLKSFCAFVTDNTQKEKNIITSNEGAAVALASGYYIGTGNIPMVYMQNSGLGNAVNPLLSLADSDVYSIPIILLIGWRGEPGVKDEPQHIKQGKVTLDLLDAMKISYSVIDAESNVEEVVKCAVENCRINKSPYAFVVRKGTFSEYKLKNERTSDIILSREEALEIVLDNIPSDSIIISTTGMLSRELFELRERRDESHRNDFLTVGSMGHTSQIALGVALSNTHREVYCFDGDGGTIMHLGSYAILGNLKLKNLKIILFNNGAHDSVGGQPTIGFETDFQQIFRGFGFDRVFEASDVYVLREKLAEFIKYKSKCFLEVKIRKGARKNLGRPTQTPQQTKQDLMKFIKNR